MSATGTDRASVRSQHGPLTQMPTRIRHTTKSFVGAASIRLPKDSSLNHDGKRLLNATQLRIAIMETIKMLASEHGVFTVNDVRTHVEGLNAIYVETPESYGACFVNAQSSGIIEAVENNFTQTAVRPNRRGVTVWKGKG